MKDTTGPTLTSLSIIGPVKADYWSRPTVTITLGALDDLSGVNYAVIDFDTVARDPAHPDRLRPAYDSGDHLHPSAAGYKAMADAIPLELVTR